MKLIPLIITSILCILTIKEVKELKYNLSLIIIFTLISYLEGANSLILLLFFSLIIHVLFIISSAIIENKTLNKIMGFNIFILCICLCFSVLNRGKSSFSSILLYLQIALAIGSIITLIVSKSILYIPISGIFLIMLTGYSLNLKTDLLNLINSLYILTITLYQSKSKEKKLIRNNTSLIKELNFTHSCFRKIYDSIYSGSDIKIILNNILEGATEVLNCDSGAFYIIESGSVIEICATEFFVNMDINNIESESQFIHSTETEHNKKYNKYTFNNNNYISSIIIRPIKLPGGNHGVMILQNNTFQKKFNTTDFERSETFSNFANIALENINKTRELLQKREIDKEIKIAGDIQKNLVSNKFKTNGVSVSVISRPAKGMNGDYYNVIPLPDGRTLIVICDVAGKGIPAAIVTVIINTITTLIANQIVNTSTLLNCINNALISQVNIEKYATMSCLIVDPKVKTITYSNAGHHPCLIKRGNKVRQLTGDGLPVGVVKKTVFQNVTFNYNKDDSILLYTDGISESMNENGDQFSVEGIKKIFLSQDFKYPTHMVAAIFQKSEDFSYPDFEHDDRTIIGVTL